MLEAGSAAAGALIGAIALYPFETVKVKLQAATKRSHDHRFWTLLTKILQEDGIGPLFAGLRSKCMESMISAFSYFYW